MLPCVLLDVPPQQQTVPALTTPRRPPVGTFQGKLEEARPLYVQVLEILSATVGEEHPNYASTLNNRAMLLERQVRVAFTHDKKRSCASLCFP